jgi:hypothetical protein
MGGKPGILQSIQRKIPEIAILKAFGLMVR